MEHITAGAAFAYERLLVAADPILQHGTRAEVGEWQHRIRIDEQLYLSKKEQIEQKQNLVLIRSVRQRESGCGLPGDDMMMMMKMKRMMMIMMMS